MGERPAVGSFCRAGDAAPRWRVRGGGDERVPRRPGGGCRHRATALFRRRCLRTDRATGGVRAAGAGNPGSRGAAAVDAGLARRTGGHGGHSSPSYIPPRPASRCVSPTSSPASDRSSGGDSSCSRTGIHGRFRTARATRPSDRCRCPEPTTAAPGRRCSSSSRRCCEAIRPPSGWTSCWWTGRTSGLNWRTCSSAIPLVRRQSASRVRADVRDPAGHGRGPRTQLPDRGLLGGSGTASGAAGVGGRCRPGIRERVPATRRDATSWTTTCR